MLKNISCHDFIKAGEYAYFSNCWYNGLFKVNIQTGETVFLDHFKGERYSEQNLHQQVLLRNDKIYFCPRRSGHLHIYNLSDQSIEAIEIRRPSEQFFTIKSVAYENDALFFIPHSHSIPIRKFDLKTCYVTGVRNWKESEKNLLPVDKDVFPAPELIAHIEGGKLFFWRQRQTSDRIWHGFLPLGRELLRYTEGTGQIDLIPLSVVNDEELKKYQYKIVIEILNSRLVFEETLFIDLLDFLSIVKATGVCEALKSEDKSSIGENIWNNLD